MQPCLMPATGPRLHTRFLGLQDQTHILSLFSIPPSFTLDRMLFKVSCSFNGRKRTPNPIQSKRGESGRDINRAKVKSKENVWSVDNELAKAKKAKGVRRNRKERRVNKVKKKSGGTILVSGPMLMEVETVLQTQEPVIRPAWNTFASSVSGIWKGVGAVFSPITAEMEPIEIGSKSENLYDCYTLSCIEEASSVFGGKPSKIHRKINWVTFNPHGEAQLQDEGSGRIQMEQKESGTMLMGMENANCKDPVLPTFASLNFRESDLMEEDVLGNHPGLVFFEDGSYSKGPLEIPVGEVDESSYYMSPTFKFEQCLMKGCNKRLRIVHTIEFNNGGADIQILRVAVYEEQLARAVNTDERDVELDLKPLSQRKRTQPSELVGSWKVFEVSATPILNVLSTREETTSLPYVYLCTETIKKMSLPETLVYFGEEEMVDMQDATILWLPGGVMGYVDVSKDGTLCVGVGWYSDEGVNIVMERDYGGDGKLKEARNRTEVKRRWPEPLPLSF